MEQKPNESNKSKITILNKKFISTFKKMCVLEVVSRFLTSWNKNIPHKTIKLNANLIPTKIVRLWNLPLRIVGDGSSKIYSST